jgi:hypothetical protein
MLASIAHILVRTLADACPHRELKPLTQQCCATFEGVKGTTLVL